MGLLWELLILNFMTWLVRLQNLMLQDDCVTFFLILRMIYLWIIREVYGLVVTWICPNRKFFRKEDVKKNNIEGSLFKNTCFQHNVNFKCRDREQFHTLISFTAEDFQSASNEFLSFMFSQTPLGQSWQWMNSMR